MTIPLRMDASRVLHTLERANNPPAQWSVAKSTALTVWRCVHVQKMSDEDNQGNHNVYVDVIDTNGNRIDKPGVVLTFGWGASGVGTYFEKPSPEPGANFMLSAGMNAWCQVDGGDIVESLMGENGHTSYYVVFQLQTVQSTQPQPPINSDLLNRIIEVERMYKELGKAIDNLR